MYKITNEQRRIIIDILSRVGEDYKIAHSTKLQNKGRLARLVVKALLKTQKL